MAKKCTLQLATAVPANILSLCLLIVFSFGEEKLLLNFKPEHCFFFAILTAVTVVFAYKAPYCKTHIELSRAGTFLYIKKMNCVNMDNTK